MHTPNTAAAAQIDELLSRSLLPAEQQRKPCQVGEAHDFTWGRNRVNLDHVATVRQYYKDRG
jgi:hypothetical protein